VVALPRVRAAAAAAILTTKYIEDSARDELEEGQRFFVHLHVAELEPDEPALASYLGDIYNSDRQVPIDVELPGGRNGATFKALAASDQVAAITGAIAEQLRIAMESKQAKPGILFGFSLQHQHGADGYGIGHRGSIQAGKKHTHHNVDLCESSPDPAHDAVAQLNELMSDSRRVHQVPRQDEQRNCHERKTIQR